MQLRGKTAIVTGGAMGIGEAIATRLARAQASVLIADVDAGAGSATAARLGTAFQQTDMCSDADVRALVAAAEREFGGLDILINNAGGMTEPHYPEAPPASWVQTLDLNLRSVMVATQYAIEKMAERGGGAIVNIASVAGLGFEPHPSPEYAVAKAGVVRLTATLAPLRARYGIRVNCICPDIVDTQSSRRDRAGMSADQLASLPPVLEPAAIAEAVVAEFLESDEHAGRVMLYRGGEPYRLLPVA
jgi:NAD(P)-dependent dehydrogenase (short-subunit alcohol dehydrogenase family)